MTSAKIDAQIDRALNAKVAVLLVSSIVAVVVLALLISTAISRGIRSVGLQLGQLSDAALAGNLDARVDPLAVSTDFRDVVGKVNGLVEVFVRAIRDVSRMMDEKQQLEDRISRMQRLEAIGTLAGGIAHDFNNILTYLFAYADIAQSLLPEGSPASPHLVQIVAGTQRAADLVGQILTFSRQVHGQTHPLDSSRRSSRRRSSSLLPPCPATSRWSPPSRRGRSPSSATPRRSTSSPPTCCPTRSTP